MHRPSLLAATLATLALMSGHATAATPVISTFDTGGIAIAADGKVWEWGDDYNKRMQFAQVNTTLSGTVVHVAKAYGGRFAVMDNGDVYWWKTNTSTPTKVSGVSNIAKVFAGYTYVTFIDKNGDLWWASANNAPSYSATQVKKVTGLNGIKKTACIESKCAALLNSGEIWEFTYDGSNPQQASSSPAFTDMTLSGGQYTPSYGAIDANGQLWAWGYMAVPGKDSTATPQAITGLPAFAEITGSTWNGPLLAARTADGQLYSWGGTSATTGGYCGGNVTSYQPSDWTYPANAKNRLPGVNVSLLGNGFFMRADGTVFTCNWSNWENGTGALYSSSNELYSGGFPIDVLTSTSNTTLDLLPAVANTGLPNGVRAWASLREADRITDKSPPTQWIYKHDLSFTLMPEAADVGQNRKIYLIALAGSSIIMIGSDGSVTPFSGSNPTPFKTAILSSTMEYDPVFKNVDLSAIAGVQLYVGYGQSLDEMISAGRYKYLLTLPGANGF